jgi:hypothetical protein
MRSTLSAASCSLPACKRADEAEASLFDWEGIASRRTSPFEPVRLRLGSYPEPAARLTVRLKSEPDTALCLKSEPVRLRLGEVPGIPFAGTAPGTARPDSRFPLEPSATALAAAGAPAPLVLPPLVLPPPLLPPPLLPPLLLPPLPPLLPLGSPAELHVVGSVGLPVLTSPTRSARRGRSVIA